MEEKRDSELADGRAPHYTSRTSIPRLDLIGRGAAETPSEGSSRGVSASDGYASGIEGAGGRDTMRVVPKGEAGQGAAAERADSTRELLGQWMLAGTDFVEENLRVLR